jgi:plasmid stability protein
MKNLTLSIDETVLERVRVYAAKHKTTVNRLVREHLQQLVRSDERAEGAREALLRLIDKSPGRLGPDWKWDREDAYEGRVLPRHKRPALRRARKAG